MKRILIVGGVAAGTSAASKARRTDPDAEVKIIQEEPVVSYGACGMPYVIEGLIDDFNRVIARPAERFKNKYNIDVIANTRAVKIDRLNRKVYAETLNHSDNGNEYSNAASNRFILDYDSLVIATGARSAVPKIKGIFVNDDTDTSVNKSSAIVKGLLSEISTFFHLPHLLLLPSSIQSVLILYQLQHES
jgi:NADPH-dependent 2,4-dienoyl-CoA reductase/sulfur reductase-like enzyme